MGNGMQMDKGRLERDEEHERFDEGKRRGPGGQRHLIGVRFTRRHGNIPTSGVKLLHGS
jgi:hypothetical protein